MKATFIYPDMILHSKGKSPREGIGGQLYDGIACLSAYLKQARHETSLIHVRRMIDESDFIGLVSEDMGRGQTGLFAFSVIENYFPYVIEYSTWLKKRFNIPIVAGGPYATLCPEEVIKAESIDAVCVGEGEEPLVEICDRLERGEEITSIENMWVKRGGQIFRNPTRPFIRDLDSLPFPDIDLFDVPNLTTSHQGVACFMASRGCPYNCSYCCSYKLSKAQKGKYVRFKSVGYIIAEIKRTLEKYPFFNIIQFNDDILPLNKRWFEEFATAYRKGIGLPLRCSIRPNLLDERTAQLLKEANCELISIGIESGNDYIRNEILERHIKQEQIIKAFALCRQYGIQTHSFNIVGSPFEDSTTLVDTIKLNAKIGNRKTQASILYPYSKTRIRDLAEKQNILVRNALPSYFTDSIIRSYSINPRQLRMFSSQFGHFVTLYYWLYRIPVGLSRAGVWALDKALSHRLFPILWSAFLFVGRPPSILIRSLRSRLWARRRK